MEPATWESRILLVLCRGRMRGKFAPAWKECSRCSVPDNKAMQQTKLRRLRMAVLCDAMLGGYTLQLNGRRWGGNRSSRSSQAPYGIEELVEDVFESVTESRIAKALLA